MPWHCHLSTAQQLLQHSLQHAKHDTEGKFNRIHARRGWQLGHLSTMRLRLTISAGVFLMASWMWKPKPFTLSSASAFLFSGVSIRAACIQLSTYQLACA